MERRSGIANDHEPLTSCVGAYQGTHWPACENQGQRHGVVAIGASGVAVGASGVANAGGQPGAGGVVNRAAEGLDI